MDLSIAKDFDKGLYHANPEMHSDLRVVFAQFLLRNGFRINSFCDALLYRKNCYSLDNSNMKDILKFVIYRGWIHCETSEDGTHYLVADAPIENLSKLFDSIGGRKSEQWYKKWNYISSEGEEWLSLQHRNPHPAFGRSYEASYTLPTNSIKTLTEGYVSLKYIKNIDIR